MEVSGQSVEAFLDNIEDKQRRQDSQNLVKLMQAVTGKPPKMWGSSIIGFGTYHYKYDSGREGDTVIVGFSPRKQALVLYGVLFYNHGAQLAKKLGKFTAGKGCLYIKHLADVDETVLKQMIKEAYQQKKA